MKQRFVELCSTLARSYGVWAGLLFTVGGAVYSLKGHNTWLLLLFLAPLTLAALGTAWGFAVRAARSTQLYDDEKRSHDHTKEKLDHAAAEALAGIRGLIKDYSVGSAANLIRRSVDLVARHQALQEALTSAPEIRKVTLSQQRLFITARFPAKSLAHVRENDPFVLEHLSNEGIRHIAAMLRVHQPPDSSKRIAILAVDQALNEETVTALQSLAQLSDEVPHGFEVRIALDLKPFDGLDFGKTDTVLDKMAQYMGDVYLNEMTHG